VTSVEHYRQQLTIIEHYRKQVTSVEHYATDDQYRTLDNM